MKHTEAEILALARRFAHNYVEEFKKVSIRFDVPGLLAFAAHLSAPEAQPVQPATSAQPSQEALLQAKNHIAALIYHRDKLKAELQAALSQPVQPVV